MKTLFSHLKRASRHLSPKSGSTFLHLEPLVNKTISPKDALYPIYKNTYDERNYFLSGLRQLTAFDTLLYKYTKKTLIECQSIADFACHYGRLLRCLRAALPNTRLYACDIDPEAVDFCVREFGCLPLRSTWDVDEITVEEQHDLVFCISLLTHTRKEFFSNVLRLWEKMLRPGGLLLFTFLGEEYISEWISGRLNHYGPVDNVSLQKRVGEFQRYGYAFHGYTTGYSSSDEYGIGFISKELVQNEVKAHPGLKFQEFISGFKNDFSQDLAVVLKSRR